MKTTRLWRKWMVIPLALIALGLLGAAVLTFGMPQTRAQVGGLNDVTVEVLAGHSTFPDEIRTRIEIAWTGSVHTHASDPSHPDHAMMARLNFGQGGSVDWHIHPGPVIVLVTEGALTVTNAADCAQRVYSAGQAFMELGGMVHKANNNYPGETVAYVTFLEVPDGSGPTTFVPAAAC